jgi:hypothetical protein
MRRRLLQPGYEQSAFCNDRIADFESSTPIRPALPR